MLAGGRRGGEEGKYPGVVEFCLQADVLAFFLVLCTQHLQFIGLQWAFYIGGIYSAPVSLHPGMYRMSLSLRHNSQGSDGDIARSCVGICSSCISSVELRE